MASSLASLQFCYVLSRGLSGDVSAVLLSHLSARDLVSLACTSSTLHDWLLDGSAPSVWQRAAKAELPHHLPASISEAKPRQVARMLQVSLGQPRACSVLAGQLGETGQSMCEPRGRLVARQNAVSYGHWLGMFHPCKKSLHTNECCAYGQYEHLCVQHHAMASAAYTLGCHTNIHLPRGQ